MAGSASARGSALCKYNHLQAVERQWQDQHQQGCLHFASTITYILWEGNGRISISKGVCTLQAQSLTFCGKAMAGSASARGSALCKHNHLLSVGRQWQDQHQQEGLHFASTITYFLWKGNGSICISKGDLQFASTITYSLWEGNGSISISKGVCTLQAQSPL